MLIYVGIFFIAWLLWLIASEMDFRRRIRRYEAETERLYGPKRKGC